MSQLAVLPIYRATDSNGNPLPGAKLYFYQEGTLTPAAVYTTAALTTPHASPVVADAGGLFANIFLSSEVSYRAILKTAGDVEVKDMDPISDQVTADIISAEDFGAVGDGVADDTDALEDAVAAHINQNGVLYIPPGTYKVTRSLEMILSNYLSYATGFAPAPRIYGAGPGRTIIDSRVANGFVFDIDSSNPHTSTFQGLLNGFISDLTIRTASPAVVSGGIRLETTYAFRLENLHIIALTGDAIRLLCDFGDIDANNMIAVINTRIENCLGWGINAGDAGHNETSYLVLDRTFIQNCGTASQKAISAITNAGTAVVTATAHGFANDTKVYIGGAEGMTQVNSYTAETQYTVKNKTNDAFDLYNAAGTAPINSSGYGTFTVPATITNAVKTAGVNVLVTAVAHGMADGAMTDISGVLGMTQLNGNRYVIDRIDANSFYLRNTASGTYSAYSSGGTATVVAVVFPAVPTSGGMRWKGQICNVYSSGFTICKNVSIYVNGLGGGLPQNFTLSATGIENPQMAGIIVDGVLGLVTHEDQVYNGTPQNGNAPCFWGWLFDGTNAVIKHVRLNGSCVRTREYDPAFYTAFQIFGDNADKHTIRIRDVTWKEFYDHQTRFRGVQFDPIPQHGRLTVVNATTLRLRPDPVYGIGNKMPVRTRNAVVNSDVVTNGEWVPLELTSTGLSYGNTLAFTATTANGSPILTVVSVEASRLVVGGVVTGAGIPGATTILSIDSATQVTLSANATATGTLVALTFTLPVSTILNAYLVAANSVVLAGQLELASTAPTQDTTHGYMVKTGEANKLWLGRVQTDGSGQFVVGTTSVGVNWLNPMAIPGFGVGTPNLFWSDPSTFSLNVKQSTTLPTSSTDSNYRFRAIFGPYTATYDPGSIANGASATTTVTATGAVVGDKCEASFSLTLAGLTVTAYISAADTATVVFGNLTGGAVDLASGTLRVWYTKV